MGTMIAVGNDATLSMTDQGPQDGSPAVGTAIDVTARLRSVEITLTRDEIDTSGASSGALKRTVDRGWTLTAEVVVPITGLDALTGGNYVTAEYKVYSGLATPASYAGVLREVRISSRTGEAATATYTIIGPADPV